MIDLIMLNLIDIKNPKKKKKTRLTIWLATVQCAVFLSVFASFLPFAVFSNGESEAIDTRRTHVTTTAAGIALPRTILVQLLLCPFPYFSYSFQLTSFCYYIYILFDFIIVIFDYSFHVTIFCYYIYISFDFIIVIFDNFVMILNCLFI